jgi:CheY-like chemotaxis protein/HPt (histidine-containing phosphotransfer) domain-containing protein
MGGGIGVDSVPGVGSCFRFEAPLEVGDEAALAAVPADALPAVRPLRVLLAEDVELNRDLVTEVLGRHGHAVVVAADGREAVERAGGGGFDLVLMDMQMPFMDGIEATRRIRRLEGPAGRVPIVGLTANVMERDRQLCLAAGMQDCLGKPVDWPQVFAAMARHAGEGRQAEPAEAGAGETAPEAPPSDGGGAREVPPEPAPSAGEAGAPGLIDRAMLERLAASLPGGAFAGFVRRGIENAERACVQFGTLPAGSEELARTAHSLKGTSGSFGLKGISALAGEIEAAAGRGEDVSGPAERLREVVAATRAELRAAGLLGDMRAVGA